VSLTSFLEENADVRARFLADFKKPEFRIKSPLLAPPLTKSYSLAGMAFDYLLRFYLEKLNSDTKASIWVAEHAMDSVSEHCTKAEVKKATLLLNEAKKRYRTFKKSAKLLPPPTLIEAAVWMSSLETVYRAGRCFPNTFAAVESAMIDDLRAMLSVVPVQHFRADMRCILNPTFGQGSELVGGADADLIIDDTLIDIKASSHLVFDRDFFNQLVGYYALSCIGGVDNCSGVEIKHLAVYYARYGFLHRVPVQDCIAPSALAVFLKWLRQRASC
jgi:hypothetical protein